MRLPYDFTMTSTALRQKIFKELVHAPIRQLVPCVLAGRVSSESGKNVTKIAQYQQFDIKQGSITT